MRVSSLLVCAISWCFANAAVLPDGRGTGQRVQMPVIANGVVQASIKQTPGKVFLCTGYVWDGVCGTSTQEFDKCITLTPPLFRQVSSIGPDPGNALVLFRDANCEDTERSFTMFSPGSVDLRTEGWDNQIGSLRIRRIAGDYCIGRGWDRRALPSVSCERCCNGCDEGGDCKPWTS